MQYKKFLFPEQEKKKNLWLKITWKWFKIILGTFLLMSTVWGCGQILGDSSTSSGTILSAYDFKNHNIAAVFFEIIIGNKSEWKHHVFHLSADKKQIYEYGFSGITSWGAAWTQTKSPFFGFFVYPIAWLLVNISAGLSGGDATNPISTIFAIIFTTVIIKLITLIFTFRAQQNQERMQAVQMKTSEIQAKYKHSRAPGAKQKMQMELMAIYKKEGINPMTAFIPMLLSLPFLTAMYQVMRSTQSLKNTTIGVIKLIETPWSMITSGHWMYLVIVVVYLPIQVVSVLLPMILNRSKVKIKTKESKAAFKKQMIIQCVMMIMFVFYVFITPAGVGIYWIISGVLQITQTLGFHQYNKNKKNRYKKKGTLTEPFLVKFKNIFKKISN